MGRAAAFVGEAALSRCYELLPTRLKQLRADVFLVIIFPGGENSAPGPVRITTDDRAYSRLCSLGRVMKNET